MVITGVTAMDIRATLVVAAPSATTVKAATGATTAIPATSAMERVRIVRPRRHGQFPQSQQARVAVVLVEAVSAVAGTVNAPRLRGRHIQTSAQMMRDGENTSLLRVSSNEPNRADAASSSK